MRKLENHAGQLLGNLVADQHLCFRCIDGTIPLLPKSEISSLKPSSVAVQPGLCQTWLETPKTGFLMTQLMFKSVSFAGYWVFIIMLFIAIVVIIAVPYHKDKKN